MSGAEPFFYQGGKIGCLLVHGFTATPQEMQRLGRFLASHGYTVHAPLLAGHGTRVQDLNGRSWRDWHRSALEAWESLDRQCSRVFAIGLSLGGALALYLASQVTLAGVVAMATPLILDAKLLWLARLMKYLLPYRKKGPSDIKDPAALAQRVAYDHTSTRSQEQVLLFLRHLNDTLPEVRVPVLLIHSRQDTTVEPQMMPRIYERLGSDDKRLLWLDHSGHIVTEDREREQVYEAIRNFVEQHS
jgi:carboxylesterase